MKNLSIGVFSIIVIFLISSCTRTRTYDFESINTTHFNLEVFEIGNHEDIVTIQINPYDTAQITGYEIEGVLLVKEPLLGLAVSEYSDSTGSYSNNSGSLTSILDLDKDNFNIIKVVPKNNSIYENDIFAFEVNE